MKTFILFLTIFTLVPAGLTLARPIVFRDFNWSISPAEVEAKAAGYGFHFKKKFEEDGELKLTYITTFMAKDCTVTFSFTPLSKKLYTVKAVWGGTSYGYYLKDRLEAAYRTPRVEMEAVKLHIWTRKNTELELRHDEDETVLTYSDLNLWSDYREEKKILDERRKEEETD